MRFVPYLFTLFFFILVNNSIGVDPVHPVPDASRASASSTAWPLLSWVIYNGVGIRKHGFVGYLKLQSRARRASTGPILLLLVPLEFFSNIIVRPVTLALRLFANMFAGHLLLILFALGGEYLLVHWRSPVRPGRHFSLGRSFIAIAFLELLVQFLQAYVFTLLNAMYISGALADEH